jgi:hypothetical protein
MHTSQIVVVGLGAFAAQALAGGVDTVVDTTVITVSSSSLLPSVSLHIRAQHAFLVQLILATFIKTNSLTSLSDHILRSRGQQLPWQDSWSDH